MSRIPVWKYRCRVFGWKSVNQFESESVAFVYIGKYKTKGKQKFRCRKCGKVFEAKI